MRVVIDTNVFVSGLMLPASIPGRILAVAYAGGFEIVLCEAISGEIAAALRYPEVRKCIALSDEELDRCVRALRYAADVVDPTGVVVVIDTALKLAPEAGFKPMTARSGSRHFEPRRYV
ncbi:MAG TPA: PIN domain-containing protein [Casimicrobiaceae bacterium]|nr:PIN domain-containing protein [Casimicrobiaceae bacterium]